MRVVDHFCSGRSADPDTCTCLHKLHELLMSEPVTQNRKCLQQEKNTIVHL